MSTHQPIPSPTFRVAEWRVLPELHRIELDGESVPLEPRIMALLVHLAERPGQVLGREELLGAVWGDVVVQEEALTHAVSRLRSAFGDDRRAPRFIETIPKRGYRLVAAVSAVEPPDAEPSMEAGARPGAPSARPAWIAAILAASLAAFMGAAALALAWALRPRAEERADDAALLTSVPLTGLPGREFHPAISPDGTRTAFAWSRDHLDDSDLYVTQRSVQEPLELTDTPGSEHGPCWSPDGSQVAFLHDSEWESTSVRVVAAIGGPPRTLLQMPPTGAVEGIDWHPGGAWLAGASRAGTDAPWSLQRIPLDGGPSTPLFPPVEGTLGDTQPALSPSGERIAFLRADEYGFADVHVAELDGSGLQRLTFGQGRIRGLDWRVDGSAIVFSSGTAFASEFRLWSLDVESLQRTWLPTRGLRAIYPSIASATGDMVYAAETFQRQLERVTLSAGSLEGGEVGPAPFARSSSSEYDAHHSPSGERVAFVSTRSGQPEVWVSDAEGKGVRRVTSFGGAQIEFLKWSEDERMIAYDATIGDRSIVHVTDVAQETTRPLTEDSKEEILMGWSKDSRFIYLNSLEDRAWRACRVEVATGRIEVVLPFRVFMLAESEDGESIHYVRPGPPILWQAERDGSNPRRIFEAENGRSISYWKLTPGGLIFYRRQGAHTQVAFRHAADGEIEELYRLPTLPLGLIDVSLDCRFLLYDHTVHIESDLVLVERTR